ncbi:GGDEF domain-containing protein [Rhizobium sp. Root1220]|uniref:GGDEF domain-containing protein n=1 Tax=Rhizobium sp. Root1220 TaxID=1736432 RepID=UPI0006FFA7FD|nr:GGDEF domain-containing protein [Rhizobium sp. Root1220]KQV66235.1 diguanylate cyclase [Rhizobium sp. Root1220]
MILDLRTIYVVSAMTCLVLGSVHLAAHHTGRFGRWPAWWGASNLLVGIGSFCVALREVAPSFISVDAGNVMTIVGYVLMVFAVRVFADRPVEKRYCALVVACISLPVLMFTIDPSAVSERLLYVSIVCCVCDLAVLREGVGIFRREKLFSAGLLAWLYVPTAAIFFVRGLLAATGEIGGPNPFGSSMAHGWMAATAVVFMALRSMVIVLMAAERSRNQLIGLAHYDSLTGALNRGGLAQRLSERKTQSLALLAIDIDHFKQLNDLHGHVVGDQMLKLLVQVAESALRPGDLLARLGGDEFLAVLKDVADDGAVGAAERIRLAFASAASQVPGLTIIPTLSIGVAISTPDDGGFERLLQKADEALYYSKRQGRNRVEAWSGREQAA